MQPTITVDAKQAYARFSEAGIPEQVRNNLRRLLPQLGKSIGAQVEANIDARLQSSVHLSVTKQMVENPRAIYIRIAHTWTGDAAKAMVPQWLETGTRPHEIRARNVRNLAFYWPKIGDWFFGPKVNHPGTPPFRIVEDAMARKESEIADTLNQAVKGL